MDHSFYTLSDPSDLRFQTTAIMEGDELLIDIRTELESGERSAILNELGQLRKILAHFYPRYKSIRTSWRFGNHLVAFNGATAAGAIPEQAAIRTALGHQIALAGFSHALIRSLKGTPARYTEVLVSFQRPRVELLKPAKIMQNPNRVDHLRDRRCDGFPWYLSEAFDIGA